MYPITLNLPGALYERLKQHTQQTERSVEAELLDVLVTAVPVADEHFIWAGEGARIAGLTPVGRATVMALNLNRPSLVKARQLWVQAGWHPSVD